MSVLLTILLVVLVAAAIVYASVLVPRGDRKRIHENIEAHGGKVLEIVQDWMRGNRYYERAYNVTYTTSDGATVKAGCRTNGAVVRWLSSRPPTE
jgi:hypothetical protein